MSSAPQFFKHGPGSLARLLFFVLLSILLMVEDTRLNYFPEIRQTIAVVIYPLQRTAHVPASVYGSLKEFLASFHLIKENEFLKQRHLIDRKQLLQLQALEAENSHLRQLLGAVQRIETKAIIAQILYFPRDPFNHKATLNKGSQHGIQPGQIVVDDKGVIGQITQTYLWSSELTLITDNGHAVPTQTVRNGLRSLVTGSGKNGELDVRYLSINSDIQLEDLLVTSGIDGVYPPGLPVAEIAMIERNPANPFAKITSQPVAGVDQNRQVLILSFMPPALETLSEVPAAETTDSP